MPITTALPDTLNVFVNKIEKNACPHEICVHVVKGDNTLASEKCNVSDGAECYGNNSRNRG